MSVLILKLSQATNYKIMSVGGRERYPHPSCRPAVEKVIKIIFSIDIDINHLEPFSRQQVWASVEYYPRRGCQGVSGGAWRYFSSPGAGPPSHSYHCTPGPGGGRSLYKISSHQPPLTSILPASWQLCSDKLFWHDQIRLLQSAENCLNVS